MIDKCMALEYALGVEFGSTRIKAAAIPIGKQYRNGAGNTANFQPITASFTWESQLQDGFWSYPLDVAWMGLSSVLHDIGQKIPPSQIRSFGVSAMMHGFLAFNKQGELITPFRTWKNENTTDAATRLSELFSFNIPLRWSIAHLYQAILDQEEFVHEIDYVTTLAGYIHWCLTGDKVLGIGDASGMFPIRDGTYDCEMAQKFLELTGIDIHKVFPKILVAGMHAGNVTPLGAALCGDILPVGLSLCPPEGDAGTGMVVTNATKPRTGNVSAGTSVFAMIVLEKALHGWYSKIDVVTTPFGAPVAMVHVNDCTNLIDPWIELFGEAAALLGVSVPNRGVMFSKLYECAVNGDSALSRFMRERLTLACDGLKEGLRILKDREGVVVDRLAGHGGFFKSGIAGRVIMEESLGIPIVLPENAGEGGAWGMAELAAMLVGGGCIS